MRARLAVLFVALLMASPLTLAPPGAVSAQPNPTLPQLRVLKDVVPDADPGKFDLYIDTTKYDNGGAGFGGYDTIGTGYQTVDAGSHDVSELAHTGTDLANYVSSISCDNGASGSGTSLSTGPLSYGDVVTCTITNSWQPECTAHCDCPQKSFCYYGRCLTDPKSPVYCADNPGCPPGRWAFKRDGGKGTCAEDPNYVCGDACDCGPAHCCKYDPAVGHNVCVKDTTDPWNPGGTAIGPPCQSGVDATYCCGDPLCYAGRYAYGNDAASFRCIDRETGTVGSLCTGTACYGTACNCSPGESCLDTLGQGSIDSTCFLLGGGSCVSNAVAEAVYGLSPAVLIPCCGKGCFPGQQCEKATTSGCGSSAYQRLVGVCGSCGNGTCEAGEFPTTCPADCTCGDGVCAPSEVGSCPADCGTCGNGTCDPGESTASCRADCQGSGDARCEMDESVYGESADCGCPDAAYYPHVFAACGDGLCSDADLSPETPQTCPQDCTYRPLNVYTNGLDADREPGSYVAVGDTVSWTYVINNSREALGSVAVADDGTGVTPVLVAGDVANPGVLDQGETWVWQASGVALAGQHLNHGTLTATTTTGVEVTYTDPSHYLGVDPDLLAVDLDQLEVSRRLGGSSGRYARYFAPDVARDTAYVGETLYVVGHTQARDFPVTDGSGISTQTWDAFLAAIDADGSLAAATLLGPGTARAITSDGSGSLYVGGSFGLQKLDPGFSEAYSRAFDVYGVAVDTLGRALVVGNEGSGIARISADGATLEYQNTGLGGLARAVVAAPDGSAYVTGEMGVVKVDVSGQVVWTTSLGGDGYAITLHGGDLYVVGESAASGHATPGAYDAELSGDRDAFLAVLAPSGAVEYWSYLGGTAADAASDVVVDPFGLAYVVGMTSSSDFPVTADGADRFYQGHGDAFVAKVRPAGGGGTDLFYATFLGASDPGNVLFGGVTVELPYLMPDRALGVALGPDARTYIVGESGAPDLPIVGDSGPLGFTDAFIVSLMIPNRDPVAKAGVASDVLVGEPVVLDGSASADLDGTVVSYRWRLPDGSTIDGSPVEIVFSQDGAMSVTLTVTDDRGGTGSDTVVITVRTPAQAVRGLIDDIRGMGLPATTQNGLIAKLKDAAAALDKGHVRPAIGKLNDFINQVEALRGKRLTEAQANQLVASAQRILATLI